MIQSPYAIRPSRIPGAGKGVFLTAAVPARQILVYPDQIPETFTLDEIAARPDAKAALAATVRWFEERYTVSLDWPDECYINHSFAPTGIWHLGFVFAARDLSEDTELTVDYRHLLAPGQHEEFLDADTGQAIIGFSWEQSFASSLQALAKLSHATHLSNQQAGTRE
jgi:hypothetical protein